MPGAPPRHLTCMIRGLHGMFYSSNAAASRRFLRDKLGLPFTDVGGGWLIFDVPEADLGVHPTEWKGGAPAGTHDLSFYCDDIQGTVAELRAKGVKFKGEVADHGYGFVTYFTIPGGLEIQLYEPKYQKRARQPVAARAARRKPAATGGRTRTAKRGGSRR